MLKNNDKLALQYRFPLNLQLFNGDEEDFEEDDSIEFNPEEFGLSEDEVEEVESVDIPETDEEEETEEVEQEDEQEEVDETAPQKRTKETDPVLQARLDERAKERAKAQAKLKEYEAKAKLADRLMQQAGVTDPEALAKRLDEIESQRLQEQGVPPELADRIARSERELAEQRAAIRLSKFEVEADKLKSDPFYADIDEHMDELVEFADKMQISLEDAYNVKHGRRRMKEREAEIKEQAKLERQRKQAKKVDTSVSGASPKATKRFNLTPEQKAMAKFAGMTEEEYFKNLRR